MSGGNFFKGIVVGVAAELLMAYAPLILIGAIVVYIALPSPVTDHVVLLPGPDGKVGAVIVKGKGHEEVLKTAYAGVGVRRNGDLVAETPTADAVAARYAAVLEAIPPRPLSFTVYFVSGSATELDGISRATLGAIKLAMEDRPAPEITVIGHTDTIGGADANDALSAERAATVRDLLLAAGIRAASMDVAGRGERELMISTADDVDEPLNRRVEISVR